MIMWYINIFSNSKIISTKSYENSIITLPIEDFSLDYTYDVIDGVVIRTPLQTDKPIKQSFLQDMINNI